MKPLATADARRTTAAPIPATSKIRSGILTSTLALLLCVAISGCAPVVQYAGRRVYRESSGIRYDVFAVTTLPTGTSYERLEVEPLDNQMEDQIPRELVERLNDTIIGDLGLIRGLDVARPPRPEPPANTVGWSGSSLDVPVTPPVDGSRRPSEPGVASPATLILRGAIMDYDAGSQARRVLQIGIGRHAVLTLHLSFVDKETGQEVAKYVVNGEVYRVTENSEALPERLSKGIGALITEFVERDALTRTSNQPRSSAP